MLNSWLRAFFTLNKSEQRGIIVLVILIILMGALNLSLPLFFSESQNDFSEHKELIDGFIDEQNRLEDSINKVNLENRDIVNLETARNKLTPFPFDPNQLPKELWKKLGLIDSQITTIKNYEAKGGKFYKKEDLRKIYTITEYEYFVLEPFIRIKKKRKPNAIILKSVNLNTVDSSLLVSNLGFSPELAKRTIAYRNLLGGFSNVAQIKEVYGITDSTYSRIRNYLKVDQELINRIDINNVEFKELLSHPYFDFNLTKAIITARNKTGSFDDLEQLKLIDSINDSVFSKVSYYLYIRPQN